jgi:signal transduction histidine kinase
MKERALMVGGNLDIQSEPGNGTTITITVPVVQNAKKTNINSYEKQENK